MNLLSQGHIKYIIPNHRGGHLPGALFLNNSVRQSLAVVIGAEHLENRACRPEDGQNYPERRRPRRNGALFQACDGSTSETKRAVLSLITKIEEETKLDLNGGKLFIEAFPDANGGCVLYVNVIDRGASVLRSKRTNIEFQHTAYLPL